MVSMFDLDCNVKLTAVVLNGYMNVMSATTLNTTWALKIKII